MLRASCTCDRTAGALGEQNPAGESSLACSRFDAVDVLRHQRADVGVHHGGRRALVLSELGHDLGRGRDEHLRRDLLHELPDAELVGIVAKGPEQADRDRLDTLVLDQVADRFARRSFVERDDRLSGHVDPLHHLGDQGARDDRLRLVGRVHLHCLIGRETGGPSSPLHQEHRVAVAGRADESHLGAVTRHDRVGARGGAVHQPLCTGEQVAFRDVELLGRTGDGPEEAFRPVVRCGRRLRADEGPVGSQEDAVSEGAPDVDADGITGLRRVGHCGHVVAFFARVLVWRVIRTPTARPASAVRPRRTTRRAAGRRRRERTR